MHSFLVRLGIRNDLPAFSKDEIARHNTSSSCWITRGHKVYDVTEFMSHHPGGGSCLLKRGGGAADCSVDYDFHSRCGRKQWKMYHVGYIAEAVGVEPSTTSPLTSPTKPVAAAAAASGGSGGVDVGRLVSVTSTAAATVAGTSSSSSSTALPRVDQSPGHAHGIAAAATGVVPSPVGEEVVCCDDATPEPCSPCAELKKRLEARRPSQPDHSAEDHTHR